jgi:MscS family membrane protein
MISMPLAFIDSLPKWDYLVFIGLFLALAIAFNLAVIVIIKLFKHIAGKTKTDLDDKILDALALPLRIFATVSAAYFSIQFSFPGMKLFGMDIIDEYVIIFYALIAVSLARLADVFLIWYGKEIVPKTESRLDDEVFPFVRNIIKVVIYVIFIVFMLERLGIAIAPLLAGLGIAGLAVGLALQDTLTNFFAGIHILTDKPFKEGDIISVDGTNPTVTGSIDSIGWRSTKIKTADNNFVIVPNAKLAQSVITNFYAPDQKVQQIAEIGVSYDMDVKKVEEVILSTLKGVQSTNEFLSKSDEPWVRLDRFGDYSLIFKYGYFITKYDKRFEVKKQVNTDIFYAFKENKIEIPFPVYSIIQKKIKNTKD